MDLTDHMICWTDKQAGTWRRYWRPGDAPPGAVALIPWPDRSRRSDPYKRTAGACDSHVHDGDFWHRRNWLAAQIVTMHARGEVDPDVLHGVLLPLPEYRDLLPLDAIGDPEWLRVEQRRRGVEFEL